MEEAGNIPEVYPATVDKSGRVLLPIELRGPLNIDHESNLSWVRDADGLRLKTYEDTIAEIQTYFQSLSPAEDVWSEDLVALRKREAATEYANETRDV